jgi:hypothetical protein
VVAQSAPTACVSSAAETEFVDELIKLADADLAAILATWRDEHFRKYS